MFPRDASRHLSVIGKSGCPLCDRRVSKTVTDSDGSRREYFVYDGANVALVFDGDGEIQHRYLHGPSVDQFFADEHVRPKNVG